MVKEEDDKIYKSTFTFSFNPELLKLVNEKKFAEIRDYWLKELEKLEEERQLALKTNNRGLYEETWDRFRHALRMYDRYYVLADLQQKGKWTKRGW